jgi:hypothetical protein
MPSRLKAWAASGFKRQACFGAIASIAPASNSQARIGSRKKAFSG